MIKRIGSAVIGAVIIAAVSLFVLRSPIFYLIHPGQESMQYIGETEFPSYASTIAKKDGSLVIVSNPDSLLVLVNKDRRLPDFYTPPDLVIPNVRFSYNGDKEKMQMRKEAAKELEKLFQAADREGVYLFAVSAFRSYERQKALHTMYQKQEGEAVTAVSSAIPGTSEHQTGLAVDVSAQSSRFQLETSFGKTKEGKWLVEHAHEYGFIIRYPEDKTAVTGYMYEPWHIRYVGNPHADYLFKRRLTLEEAMPK
ncbi:M15 family metallopeptidase [Ectobacillus panaciterrae]|uniref:M15 family metallopeptidase n=1 Tax=Ectobacillus panaciterrae TaxID=363872 RepID=UPI0003F5A706|nr:M15 family metallopeptidase [Ectobacillus panaciterrae]